MYQVRNNDGQIVYLDSWEQAKEWAKVHGGWKISFSVGKERLRFILEDGKWVYQDIFGNY